MAYWIDDGFDTWPEVIRAGTPAVGLYVRCGSWISRNTNDGFVPSEVAAMYGSREWVTRLVDAGLWEVEGDGFRDVKYFLMGNPTAEKVRERRAAEAARKAKWREKAKSTRDTTRDETRVSPRDKTRDSALPSPAPLKGAGGQGATQRPDPDSWQALPAPTEMTKDDLDRKRQQVQQMRDQLTQQKRSTA